MHAPDQNILHWTSITTVHTAIKLKLANALSWILLLDYRSKPRKVRTKLAGTCSDFEEKVSEMVAVRGHGFAPNQSLDWRHGCHHDYSLFHLILGCSIRHLAVPFDIWLFRFACVASLFVFNLNHLTNTCAISSRMARPNRCSLYHFDKS